jgi:serine/threonine protein kinase/alpha-tubulin suppressor-like RCC1 family protein
MSLAQPLAPGTVVATDYRVEEQIARGGMGTLYRVTQLSTGADRVLKVMHARLLRDPRGRERFLQEARASARIDSDHVVQVLAAGFDDEGVPWIVMEHLRGEDLSHTLKRRGSLPPAEVLEVFRQLGHALAAAHRAGLVHRDLKPDNVFLCVPRREGVPFTVKLLDFGIAKALDESSEQGAPMRQTSAVGTPLWMAPEQAQRGEVTPAADVWSMGLLAFKLLTGRSYWRAGNIPDAPVERVLRELFGEPIDPASDRARELGAALPPGFDAWFARCVARDPQQRYRDAAEALAGLTPVLLGPQSTVAFSTVDGPRRSVVPPTMAMPVSGVGPWPSMQGAPPTPPSAPPPSYQPMYSAQGTPYPPPFAPTPTPPRGPSLLGAAVVGLLLGGAILTGGWFALTRYRDDHPSDAGVGPDARAFLGPRAADVPPVRRVSAMELSPPVSTVSAGFAHTCARASNGTVRCWGWNQFGQLGDGTLTHRPTPVTVVGLDRVVEVVVGHAHSCARRDDGTVRCWGLNSSGQLGNNTRRNSGVPVTVIGVSGALQLALGEGHTCARMSDATARCWGDNTHGQLGDGTATTRAFAGAVPGVAGVEEVEAGNLHTCVRLADTTVRCWGASNFGQVGDGYVEAHYRPAAVAGLRGAAALALGPYRSCARLDDGSVRCWGRNDTGQLGDGTRLSRTTPVTVVGLAGALDLGLGAFHACSRMVDHTLRCWGSNAFGQLGDGTAIDRPAPIPASVVGAVSVTAGEVHTCARTDDGAVRCWGGNGFGQVGDGATVNHGVPFVVPGL